MSNKKRKIPPACQGMTFEEFQERCFKDPEFAREYNILSEELKPEAEAIEKRIKERKGK